MHSESACALGALCRSSSSSEPSFAPGGGNQGDLAGGSGGPVGEHTGIIMFCLVLITLCPEVCAAVWIEEIEDYCAAVWIEEIEDT